MTWQAEILECRFALFLGYTTSWLHWSSFWRSLWVNGSLINVEHVVIVILVNLKDKLAHQCTYSFTCTPAYTHTHAHTHTPAHTHTHLHTHTHTHTYLHTCTRTHTHTHLHTHTHTHTYTHTHIHDIHILCRTVWREGYLVNQKLKKSFTKE